MSLVERCHSCDELLPRCRCEFAANPLHRPGFIESFERRLTERELREALIAALAALEIALEPWRGAAKANGLKFIADTREKLSHD